MSVLLRNVETGLYYNGAPQWTPERPDALDFEGVERALELATRPGLENVELVVSCPDGQGDLLLPMKGATPSDLLLFVQQWAST
jgi:hypothetical protein